MNRADSFAVLLTDRSESALRCATAVEAGDLPWIVRSVDEGLPDDAGDVIVPAWYLSLSIERQWTICIAYGSVCQLAAALRGGAEDFLVEPWSAEEAAARLRARNRRSVNDPPPITLHGNVLVGDRQSVVLTSAERKLLEALLRYRERVVPRDLLGLPCSRSVDVLVSRLRTKIAAVTDPEAHVSISPVRGHGYRLDMREHVDRWWKTSGNDFDS